MIAEVVTHTMTDICVLPGAGVRIYRGAESGRGWSATLVAPGCCLAGKLTPLIRVMFYFAFLSVYAATQVVTCRGELQCQCYIANFNLVCDNAAHNMPDDVLYDYVKCSDSGCQSDSNLFETYLTYMHKT